MEKEYYEIRSYLKLIIEQIQFNEAKIYEKIKSKYSYNDFETNYENNTLAQYRKDRERVERILNLIEKQKEEIGRLKNENLEKVDNIKQNDSNKDTFTKKEIKALKQLAKEKIEYMRLLKKIKKAKKDK